MAGSKHDMKMKKRDLRRFWQSCGHRFGSLGSTLPFATSTVSRSTNWFRFSSDFYKASPPGEGGVSCDQIGSRKKENERERERPNERKRQEERERLREKERQRESRREREKNTHTLAHTHTQIWTHKQVCTRSLVHINLVMSSGVQWGQTTWESVFSSEVKRHAFIFIFTFTDCGCACPLQPHQRQQHRRQWESVVCLLRQPWHHDGTWRRSLSNHINTICTRLGCLEIFRLFPSPPAPATPPNRSWYCSHAPPFLPHPPSTLPFPFPFLLSCPCQFDNLCTCSSLCKDCGGSSLCEHQRQRAVAKIVEM